MSDELKLPQVGELTLPDWQNWLARYNAILGEREQRIEKLEAALREIACQSGKCPCDILGRKKHSCSHNDAREALEELK